MKKWNRTLTTLILAVLFAGVAAAAAEQEGVVNINTASTEQLAFLPRVGPALAGRIVEFRDSNGKFKATDELILVRGIGERTYELLKPYVTIDGKTTLTEPVSSG